MNFFFQQVAKILEDAGCDSSRITSTTVTGASSRAGALLAQARQGSFGTIVVERRGLSKTKEFQMDRVADKLVQHKKNLAIWIVS